MLIFGPFVFHLLRAKLESKSDRGTKNKINAPVKKNSLFDIALLLQRLVLNSFCAYNQISKHELL